MCAKINAQTSDVVTGLDLPQGILLNGNELYIAETDAGKISKINITDSSPIITDVITGLNTPRQILLNGNELYIAETDAGRISKINITDSSPIITEVITGLNDPQGILLNGNDLYIAELGSGKVSKIDISNSSPISTDVVTGLDQPICLLLNGNDLYITEAGGGKISKINITDNSPIVIDVVTGLNNPNQMELIGNEIYIAEYLSNKISKINITESSPIATTVETELNSPTGLAFDNNNTILYISEIDGNKISKFDFSLLSTSDILNLRNKISVYPNPSKYFIKIVGLNKNENYIIYNSLGVEITNGSVFNNQKININNLSNGLYVLKFENRNVIKFIKDWNISANNGCKFIAPIRSLLILSNNVVKHFERTLRTLNEIEYLKINGGPNEIANKNLKMEFRNYHKEKAVLRLVKKELNLSRAYQARIGKTKKDLIIE